MTEFNTSDFVLSAEFVEGVDFHLQIRLGNVVLATVCEPCGPGFQSEFCVWDGDGLDEDDEETTPLKRFYTSHTLNVNKMWKEAVAYAYAYAGIQMGLYC